MSEMFDKSQMSETIDVPAGCYGFKLEISQFTPNENVIQWRGNKLSHSSRKPQELFQLLLYRKGHSFVYKRLNTFVYFSI